jgi:hypothetical protein
MLKYTLFIWTEKFGAPIISWFPPSTKAVRMLGSTSLIGTKLAVGNGNVS